MKPHKKATRYRNPLMLGLLLALTGCAATGPVFTSIEIAPADKALVYVFRPSRFVQSGNNYTVNISPSAETRRLQNGGWQQVVLRPGVYMLDAVDQFGFIRCAGVTLELKAGQTAYVELLASMTPRDSIHVTHHCQLLSAAPRDALSEMISLRRSD